MTETTTAPSLGRWPLARAVEREMRVFSKLWRGTIFSTFLSPVLFLVAMGIGVGGLVDERSGGVQGLNYLAFIVPGIMAASAMQTASGDSLWGVMAGMKWMRFFHGMVATPLRPADVYAGKVVWTGMRIALSSTVFLCIASLFGGVLSPLGVLAVPSTILTAVAFSAVIAGWSATQETDKNFAIVFRMMVMPLFLFSGTFFPVSQLPDRIEPLSRLSPLYYGVDLCRMFTTGEPRWADAAINAAVLVAMAAVGWRFGTRSFTKRLAS
ncbi:MAG TPA: ABC transporter permease [Acidimicrobiales bacterium]|nr:ABC transporter permease [Acidimicrobiales bacterium]